MRSWVCFGDLTFLGEEIPPSPSPAEPRGGEDGPEDQVLSSPDSIQGRSSE